MAVQATGSSAKSGLFFLNSEESYRDAKNFTIVLEGDVQKKLAAKVGSEDLKAFFLKKRVRVAGTVDAYQGKAQIKLEAMDKLEIVP